MLCKFFETLGVKSYESDMSFSVSITHNNLQYSGTNLFSIFAQPKNILNLNFLKMLFEIIRFNRNAEKDKKNFSNLTIDQYLKKMNIVITIYTIIFIQWLEVFGRQR